MNCVKILGAGLAGSEAALQLLHAGIPVEIYDIKPKKLLPVYQKDTYCELVCNNSLGSLSLSTPLGLLLSELEFLNSRVIGIAKKSMLKDTNTLSVDKTLFSNNVTSELKARGAKFHCECVQQIPDGHEPLIIATGPLTSKKLVTNIANQYNLKNYTFSDASSPVIDGSSIQYNDRQLQKLSDDLFVLNIPNDVFNTFFNSLLSLKSNNHHSIDHSSKLFQCQTLEYIAKQGKTSLISSRFTYNGNDKPVLLLRRETALRDAFILVGCTTALRHKEQLALFSMLPTLQNVKFIKYGRQHRNTFFRTPGILNPFFQVKTQKREIYIVGQLSGLDGYAPAIASGYIAARKIINKEKMKELPHETMIGALAKYVSDVNVVDYQPMCASFSLLQKNKQDIIKEDSLQSLSAYLNQ